MTTLRHEVTIDAPPARVWEVLADLCAVARYNPTVASATLATEQATGVGASRACVLDDGSRVRERVTDWEPLDRLGLEVAESDWPIVFMRWRTDLADLGGRTRVTQDLEYRVKFGPLGAVLDALVMRRKIDRAVARVFEGLKRHVEAASS